MKESALFCRVVNAATLESLNQDLEQARGLPNEAFTSEEFLQLEQEHLFARCWLFAGRLSAVPNAGDLLPIEVGGRPFILVRGHQGEARVFHNVCPHRGAAALFRPRQP